MRKTRWQRIPSHIPPQIEQRISLKKIRQAEEARETSDWSLRDIIEYQSGKE